MKYIKNFESINENEPKEGDFVITNTGLELDQYVGKINKKLYDSGKCRYYVYYLNLPKSISYMVKFGDKYFTIFHREDIEYWSENEEELEDVLVAKKYNL
jgi:hypothetical protein